MSEALARGDQFELRPGDPVQGEIFVSERPIVDIFGDDGVIRVEALNLDHPGPKIVVESPVNEIPLGRGGPPRSFRLPPDVGVGRVRIRIENVGREGTFRVRIRPQGTGI
jgi:hypothetical protein